MENWKFVIMDTELNWGELKKLINLHGEQEVLEKLENFPKLKTQSILLKLIQLFGVMNEWYSKN